MHKVDVNIITQKENDRRFFFCDGLKEISERETTWHENYRKRFSLALVIA